MLRYFGSFILVYIDLVREFLEKFLGRLVTCDLFTVSLCVCMRALQIDLLGTFIIVVEIIIWCLVIVFTGIYF